MTACALLKAGGLIVLIDIVPSSLFLYKERLVWSFLTGILTIFGLFSEKKIPKEQNAKQSTGKQSRLIIRNLSFQVSCIFARLISVYCIFSKFSNFRSQRINCRRFSKNMVK